MKLTKMSSVCFLVILAACNQEEAGQGTAPPAEAISHDLGPFFQSEAAMFDNMRNAIGTNSSDNWVKMMIAHHKGGAAISQDVLEEAPSTRIVLLARRVIDSQIEAVRELEALVRTGPPNLEIAHVIRPSGSFRGLVAKDHRAPPRCHRNVRCAACSAWHSPRHNKRGSETPAREEPRAERIGTSPC